MQENKDTSKDLTFRPLDVWLEKSMTKQLSIEENEYLRKNPQLADSINRQLINFLKEVSETEKSIAKAELN